MKFTAKAYVPSRQYRRRLLEAGRAADCAASAALAMAMTVPQYERKYVTIDASKVIEVLDPPESYSPIRSIVRLENGENIGLLFPAGTVRAIISELR